MQQEKLVDTPRNIALTWQEDATHFLDEFVAHSFTKYLDHIPDEEKRRREESLRDRAIDLLFRAGGL
jgi:hypothetical protein